MPKQSNRNGRLIVSVLLLALIASGFRMFTLEGQKRRIDQAYTQVHQELNLLLEEHGLLETELEGVLGDTLMAKSEDGTLRRELTRLQQRLDETVDELALIQREREALRDENITLAANLERVTTEKQRLEAKFSSIKELKLALRDIRRKVRNRRWAVRRQRIAALKAEDQRQLLAGNRGYIILDGHTTLGTGTRLHVRVLEPHSASK